MTDDPRLDLSQAALVRYLGDETATRTPPAQTRKGLHPGWWATVIGAHLADALTTNAAIGRGGAEANPVMRGIASNPTALLLSKLGIGAGMAGVSHLIHRRSPKAGTVAAAISAGIPAAAAIRNSRVMRE